MSVHHSIYEHSGCYLFYRRCYIHSHDDNGNPVTVRSSDLQPLRGVVAYSCLGALFPKIFNKTTTAEDALTGTIYTFNTKSYMRWLKYNQTMKHQMEQDKVLYERDLNRDKVLALYSKTIRKKLKVNEYEPFC